MKDRFDREINYLRISVTDECNLACRYCRPAGGGAQFFKDELLGMEDMLEIAAVAAELGVSKIRLTGGEPLAYQEIVLLCSRLSSIPGISDLAMTTNGILLPPLAAKLRDAGLRRVNISLDTLSHEKFTKLTGQDRLSDTISGIQSALDTGFEAVKINTVLIGGFNDDEILSFAELTRDKDLQLRFIELMPIGTAACMGKEAFVPVSIVTERLPELIAEPSEGVARIFRLPGHRGTIGLISPISRHFCFECNRLRLTADGYIKPCLHSADEISVRSLHGAELKAAIVEAARAKPERHGVLSCDVAPVSMRSMNRIGG